MLKFLEDRPEDSSPKRSPKKYRPEMCFGNSYESPEEFQTPHTIYEKSSYVNPFLPFEQKRAHCIIRERRTTVLDPLWRRKTNLSLVEVRTALCRNRRSLPTLRSTPQTAGTCSLSTSSSRLSRRGSTSPRESSRTSSKKTITTNPWGPCRASSEPVTGSRPGNSQCGSNLPPNGIR
jgi:hypothetical protein